MDEIAGIAILSAEPSPHDGFYYLFVVCVSHRRRTVDTASIPFAPEGQPNPGGKGWVFREDGNHLHCRPSLLMRSPTTNEEIFHNGGTWSILFERAPLDQCSDLLRERNRFLFDSLCSDSGYARR